jgi:hydroxyacylglutathione hydrolase
MLLPAGIVVLLIFVSIGAYFSLRKLQIDNMKPIPSQQINRDVYAIKGAGHVNFFIVRRGDSLVAFDSGENRDLIKTEMAGLNLNPLKVISVFLSHTDPDHVGGLSMFPNAKVYLSEEEEQMINGKTARFFLTIKNKISTAYEVVKDDQELDVAGVKIHCVLTPGHTPGSMSYIVNDVYLFPGDTLSLKNGKVNLFNIFFNMKAGQQKISIAKISKITGVKYIFTTHYGYSDDFRKAFSTWIYQ